VVKFETVEEIGIIEREDGLNATVSVLKRNACDGCSLPTCKQVGQRMTIEALNPVRARVGQKVKISIKSDTYLRSSVIVYGIPAIALVAGAVLGREVIGAHLTVHNPDNISAISGFTACILSFFAVRIWSRMVDKGNTTKPVIEEILESE
jgi:sigma-E factor negative regulatory protein RseC